MNAKSTKKAESGDSERDTMRPEYRHVDIGKGVRGKYHADYLAGSNLVLLAPDVAEVFETPQAVNEALRSLISVAQRTARRTDRPKRSSRTERASKPG